MIKQIWGKIIYSTFKVHNKKKIQFSKNNLASYKFDRHFPLKLHLKIRKFIIMSNLIATRMLEFLSKLQNLLNLQNLFQTKLYKLFILLVLSKFNSLTVHMFTIIFRLNILFVSQINFFLIHFYIYIKKIFFLLILHDFHLIIEN